MQARQRANMKSWVRVTGEEVNGWSCSVADIHLAEINPKFWDQANH